MTSGEFQMVFPFIRGWIERTLKFNTDEAKTVASFNFPRLRLYFSRDLLERTMVRREQDGQFEYAAGSGITISSDPATEMAEIRLKCRPVL